MARNCSKTAIYHFVKKGQGNNCVLCVVVKKKWSEIVKKTAIRAGGLGWLP